MKNGLKKLLKITIIIILIIIIQSCFEKPYTKDNYLNNYEVFILETKQNWKSYSDKEWQKITKKNQIFYVQDYKKFAGELRPSEYIRVCRFNFIFNFYKGEINVKALFSGEYNNVFKDMSMEFSEIVRELKLVVSDIEGEKSSVLINRLLMKETPILP